VGEFDLGADAAEDRLNSDPFPSLRNVFIVLFFCFFLALVSQLISADFLGKGKLLFSGLVLVLPALVFVAVRRFSFQTVFRLRWTDVRILAAGGIIGLGMTPVSDELDRLVQNLIPMPPDIFKALESLMQFKTTGEMILLTLALVVVAPVGEEMLFRGLLQGTLERVADINKAVFSTALIFTFIHFNPWWAMEILIVGVLLSILAWRSNSILPCIVMHAVTNGLSFLVINSGSYKMHWYQWKDHVAPYWILSGALLTYLGFQWVYHLTRKEFHHA
jgi:membrane protease YdiL (CAAX protease family)